MVLGEDHHPVHMVPQLSDVARIIIINKKIPGLLVDAVDSDLVYPLGFLQEEVNHVHQVLLPLFEGGDADDNGTDTVKEIFAERTVADLGHQIAVGGGYQPEIQLLAVVAADSLDSLCLNGPQKLYLGGQVDVAHFI